MKTTTLRSWAAVLALLLPLATRAQTPGVGIGIATPNSSAALDVSSTSKGLLPPRMTQTQRDAIASPAAGLTIFNTTTKKLNIWNGSSWDAALSATEQPLPAAAAVTFNYTGGPQTYTVPANTYRLTVDARGGAGGPAFDWYYYITTNNVVYYPGGAGARVQATLAVTPGQVLTLYVGGAGSTIDPNQAMNSLPGYNGGGNGSNNSNQYGGSGGGASDVRTSASDFAYTDRLLVAGGGGGGNLPSCGANGAGGAGGAPNGGNGACAGNDYNVPNSGRGATQTSGFARGQGGVMSYGAAQAGGGGGYYGGYGGTYSDINIWAGGGGGSSWVTPTGSSSVTMTAGANSGNGQIVVTPGPGYFAPALDGSNFVNVPGDNLGNHLATQNLNLGANQLVGNGGSTGLSIASSGNVGVGTTSPTQKLEVAGSVKIAGAGSGLTFPDGTTQTTAPTAGDLSGAITSVGLATTYNGVVPATKGGAGNLTGILRANGSGVVTAAVAADFPTLNQNTTGNAATATLASTVTTNANLAGAITSTGNTTAYNAVLPATKGGAGTVSGVLKADGAGNVSAATAGTDYSAGTRLLATGILKSTTSTGVLTIAGVADFPTLNQNTTGNAATATLASTVTTNANLTGAITSSGNATSYSTVVPEAKGGAGSISGLLKANGSGTVSQAVAGTDYLTSATLGNSYIQNLSNVQNQQSASFNISGSGTIAGNSNVGGYGNVGGSIYIGHNIHSSGWLGVVLNAQDRPLITRGYDAFTSGSYNGAGRWGLFMEPNALSFGVPAQAGKSFQWVAYNANSSIAAILMALSQSGQLGVGGVSAPTQALDADGGILARSSNPISTQGAYLQWNRSGGIGETWLINQQGGGPGGIFFGKSDQSNNVTEWARFDSNGNLGIGGASAGQRLFVNGAICSTVGLNCTSDGRYKQDVTPVQGALASVLKLRGVTYYWKRAEFPEKQFDTRRQLGFIAQEIEPYYPEMVTTDADGYKSVDYSRLTPVLVEALKEQQQQIEALKAQVAAWAGDHAALEALRARAATAEAQAAKATATTDAFEARLRALEAGGGSYPAGQARK